MALNMKPSTTHIHIFKSHLKHMYSTDMIQQKYTIPDIMES